MANLAQSEEMRYTGDFYYETAGPEDYLLYDEDEAIRAAMERPGPKMLIMFIAIFVLLKSLIPATRTFWVPLPFGFYLRSEMALMLVFAGIVVLGRILSIFSYRISKVTKNKLLIPILLLGLLQTISMAWNGQDGLHKGYSLLETVFMCTSVLAAVLLVSGLSYVNRMKVASWLAIILTFVFLVYMGLSFLFPGLRPSAAWLSRLVPTLGFIRVFGPLGAATTLNFILFPVLGFTAGQLFIPNRSKMFWGLITFFTFSVIISTGSRGAVLCLAAFFVFTIMGLGVSKALKFLIPVAFVLGIVILFVEIPERFVVLADRERAETYKTGLRAVTSSPQSFVAGVGHGGLYSSLHDNTLRMLYGEGYEFLFSRETEWGFTLTSAHSTFTNVFVETGILGLTVLMIPLLWILRQLFGRRYSRYRDPITIQAKMILAGCAGSIAFMAANTFFVSKPWLVFLWSVFVIVGAETLAETKRLAESEQSCEADELVSYEEEDF
jgi:hypothetical protein